MIKIEHKEKCTGCYSCVDRCPSKCISMKQDKEGFWYPQIDKKNV